MRTLAAALLIALACMCEPAEPTPAVTASAEVLP